MNRVPFREKVLQAREDAIVSSVNRLLAEKGFEAMTVDQVAADVGIAKASLYKHFSSKEALAAAAMVRVVERALAFIAALESGTAASASAASAAPNRAATGAMNLTDALGALGALGAVQPICAIDALRAVARWTLQLQLAGEMPALPAHNSSLRAALIAHKLYLDQLMLLSDKLGEWITEAQQSGSLNPALPPEVILYTLFARACDPVLGLLKAGGRYTDEQIIEMLLETCFSGLAGR